MQGNSTDEDIQNHLLMETKNSSSANAEIPFFRDGERTQKLIDSLSEHVVYHDMEMKVLWANQAACRSVNLALEQLIGRPCYTVWAQRSTMCDDCPAVLSKDTGRPEAVEKGTPDGRYWHIKCAPVLDANGNIEAMVEFTLDISDRKRAEDALKKSEARYRRLVETSPHGIQEIDLQGTITFANPAHHKIYGYSDQEMIGKSILELQISDSAKIELETTLARLIAEQPEPSPCISKNYTKDGRIINLQVDWNYRRDSRGRVIGFISIVTDISEKIRAEMALLQAKNALEQKVQERTEALTEANTKLNQEIRERKKAEAKLREQKDYLHALLETIPNPVFYKDADGKYTGCNKAFEDFLGRSRSDIVGKTVYDMGPKEISDKYYKMDSALFRKTGKQCYEWQVKRSDGSVRHVIFNKATINDSTGNVIGLVGVVSDISDRIRSEKALRKSESTLKAILAASPIGICLLRNRVVQWSNPAMYRIWDYEVDSLLGQDTRVLYPDKEEYERIGHEFYNAIKQYGVGKAETRWVTKKGEKIDCYIQGCRLDPLDEGKGTIVAAMDITQRKQSEYLVRKLSHMLIEAQENERKMISYELHDSIAQNLSYLKINCDTIFDDQFGISGQLLEKMDHQSKLIAQTIDAVRELSYGLHPPSLDQLGITQTIFQLCDEFSDHTGIEVDFVSTGIETLKNNSFLEINIYRLIQEGLNNIRKHAHASQVKVVLLASYPNMILRIQDNGKGFDVATSG
jgi:PAS domain S-box-containing protein